MTEPPVLSRVESNVAHVTLNRPHARNAITPGLASALRNALSDAAVYADVIVIRGAGGHFCAGGDVLSETFIEVCELIADLPIPVVAAVEGVAMACGFELIQAVDVAIVRDDAVLADNQANVGMISGGGGSPRLPRIVGTQRALGHLLTGDRISGAEAAAWGLVYRSVPPPAFEQAVAALVGNLAGRDRATLGRIKHLVRTGPSGSLGDGAGDAARAPVSEAR